MSAHLKGCLVALWVGTACLLWPILTVAATALLGSLGVALCLLLALLISTVLSGPRKKAVRIQQSPRHWLAFWVLLWMGAITIILPFFVPGWIESARHSHWQELAAPLPELGAVARMRDGQWFIHCADPADVDDAKLRLWIPKLRDMNVAGLSLQGARITDDGIASLITVRSLTHVNVSRTDVGDAGLESLSALPHLKVLVLIDTQISNEGLRSLSACPELERLYLNDTGISDAGLDELRRLQTLRYLELADTKVSIEGRNAYQRTCPHVKVIGPFVH